MYEIVIENMLCYSSNIHISGFVVEYEDGPEVSLRQITQDEAIHEIFR